MSPTGSPTAQRRLTPLPLTEFDIACGWPFGTDPDASPLPEVPPDLTARQALEEAIRPALLHEPCTVSFSGGRDSSAVLAVATHVARREGLPDPVPLTLRFPDHPDTHEDDWQELVVRHLGLDEWERLEFRDDSMELLGPVATDVLRNHGLLWPPNAYLHVPMLRRTSGGSLLTGFEGDGLFGAWRWSRVADLLSRRARPEPRDLLRVAAAIAPRALQRVVFSRRGEFAFDWPWLRPAARQEASKRHLEFRLEQPVRWDRRLDRWSRLRYHAIASQSLERLAKAEGAIVRHPLLNRRFIATFAEEGGATGFGDRTATMGALVGDLLPTRVRARSSKALFTSVTTGPRTRDFGRRLDEGFLPDCVRSEVVRDMWNTGTTDFRATTLMHAAWIANGIHDDPL